jgi:hypothetical protein
MINLNDDILFDDIDNIGENTYENTYENIRDITQIAKIFPFKPSSPIEKVVHELSSKSPLDEIKKNLEKIVKIVGMYSIIDILIFEFGNTYNLLFDKKDYHFLEFLSTLIIPINYETVPEYKTNNTIEISESLIQHDELFNQVLQLKIKTNTGKFVLISGCIKNDTNNIILKTSQICNRYIYETKKNIERYLTQSNVNSKLKKIFIKYISIYDILIFEHHDNYKLYFENFVKEFNDINTKSLAALMKLIGDKSITLTKLYKIIKYLLISDNDKIAMASIIFDILKDKKIGNTIIVDLIYDNLDYNIQIKLKKANIIIKD